MSTAATADTINAVCARAASRPGDVAVVVAEAVDHIAPLLTGAERDGLITQAVARLDGLHVLDRFLADADVDEVMVNRGREVWVDRAGQLMQVDSLDPSTALVVLERILAPLGKRLDRTQPIVDARLADGSRVCAVVAPVAVDGPTLTIRRHRPRAIELDRFAPAAVVEALEELVARRANILVTGATSTGKTTMLAALAHRVPRDERLVVLEDTTELELAGRDQVVRLEARAKSHDGVAEVSLAALVRTALRLRPDRLVVGEFRGPEVLAVVEAMNTGHDGSLSTCHANSAVDGLRRVETLVMQAAPSWPLTAIRRQVSRSIDAVVHLTRDRTGERRVDSVVEVIESDDEPTGRPIADRRDRLGGFTRGRT